MAKLLLKPNRTERVTEQFSAPAVITAFNLSPQTYTVTTEGDLDTIIPGDVVYFEQLVFDGEYDINCQGINEAGVMTSQPLLDDCGCRIELTACNQTAILDIPGIYRAVFEGRDRAPVAVLMEKP